MELYNQWIEALDSYEPAHSKLRDELNQFCCLGVLCDISNIGKWVDTGNHNFLYESYADGTDSIIQETDILPENIQSIIKFRCPRGTFNFNELSTSLQNEILKYINRCSIDNGYIALATINDEILLSNADSFSIIKKILIEQPPSLFIDKDQT